MLCRVRFLHGWRALVRFPVCPLPRVDCIDSVRLSPMLAYLAPRDQDLTWFLQAIVVLADYYPLLKERGFLNEDIYATISTDARLTRNEEIARQFECLTVEHFRLAFVLCQHLYVRATDVYAEKHRGGAKSLIRRGICVFYHYLYYYVAGGGETAIIKQIDYLKDVRVVRLDAEKANHAWCLQRFKEEHGEWAAAPNYIIMVPWRQFLTAVSRKRHFCPLENGYACVIYTQVGHWVAERWKCVVSAWRDHDHSIIDPWYTHQYAIHKPTIDKNGNEMGWRSGAFAIWRNKYYKDQFYSPARNKMLNGYFYEYSEIVRAGFNPDTALYPLYVKLFAVGRAIEDRTASERRQQSAARGDLDFRNEAETGDFYTDYGPIMPPCIEVMYTTAIETRSHFKYDDRMTFFSWTFKAGIPLTSVETMWTTMCANDPKVNARATPALLAVPSGLYRKYTLDKERGERYNFKGCAKMAQHCVFGDIENVLERAQQCIECVCADRGGRRLPAPEKWSPMLATIIKHRQRSNGDLN